MASSHRAATALRGEPLANKRAPGYPFDDSDLYKVIEGASYTLSIQRDPKLEGTQEVPSGEGIAADFLPLEAPPSYLLPRRFGIRGMLVLMTMASLLMASIALM